MPSEAHRPMVPGFLVQAAVGKLIESGVDRSTLVALGVLPPGQDAFGTHEVPRSSLVALLEAACDVMEDPALAILTGRRITEGNLHLFGPVLVASPTIREAARHMEQLQTALLQRVLWQLEEHEGFGIFRLAVDEDLDHALLLVVSVIVTSLERFVGKQRARALAVTFACPEPGEIRGWSSAFDHPLIFEQPFTGVRFPRAFLDVPRPGGDAAHAALLRDVTVRRLRGSQNPGLWTRRLEGALRSHARPASIDLGEVAAGLGLSLRALRSRLQQEGQQPSDIVDRVRCERACALLDETELGLDETATALGYSDASAFARAFKRWTGQAPGAYRSRSRKP